MNEQTKFKLTMMPSWTPDFKQSPQLLFIATFVGMAMTFVPTLPYAIIAMSAEKNEA